MTKSTISCRDPSEILVRSLETDPLDQEACADLIEDTYRWLEEQDKELQKILGEALSVDPDDPSGRLVVEIWFHLWSHRQDSQPSFPDLKPVIVPALVQECTADMMNWLSAHPQDLYSIHPGTFEKIVAHIFEREGFDVKLTGSWNQADGGVDILAVRRLFGRFDIRLAIQCKRHRRENKVSASVIRELSAVLDRFKAHAGVVATTSVFEKSVEEEIQNYLWRISLMDFEKLKRALGGHVLLGGVLSLRGVGGD